jgi:hypothetical protein
MIFCNICKSNDREFFISLCFIWFNFQAATDFQKNIFPGDVHVSCKLLHLQYVADAHFWCGNAIHGESRRGLIMQGYNRFEWCDAPFLCIKKAASMMLAAMNAFTWCVAATTLRTLAPPA